MNKWPLGERATVESTATVGTGHRWPCTVSSMAVDDDGRTVLVGADDVAVFVHQFQVTQREKQLKVLFVAAFDAPAVAGRLFQVAQDGAALDDVVQVPRSEQDAALGAVVRVDAVTRLRLALVSVVPSRILPGFTRLYRVPLGFQSFRTYRPAHRKAPWASHSRLGSSSGALRSK